MKNNIVIRLEEKSEYREVVNLVRDSFWNVYRPGCLEHYVLHQLRNDPAFVPELDFVIRRQISADQIRIQLRMETVQWIIQKNLPMIRQERQHCQKAWRERQNKRKRLSMMARQFIK